MMMGNLLVGYQFSNLSICGFTSVVPNKLPIFGENLLAVACVRVHFTKIVVLVTVSYFISY